MANESRKLNDLRVVDLRQELEKRDLDKTGVKAVLLERLQQALTEEGHDPETYVFEPSSEKKTPGKGKSEDEKGEEDEDAQNAEQDKVNKDIKKDIPNNEEKDSTETDSAKKSSTEADKGTKEESKVETSDSVAKEEESPTSKNKIDVKDTKNESNKKPETTPDKEQKNEKESQKKSNEEKKENPSEKVDEAKSQPQPQEKSKVEPTKVNEESKSTAVEGAGKKTPVKTVPSETPAKTNASPATKESSAKEEKTTDANGIIDNEDSINLTIGEDEAKMLADEEDSSQEKDQKDETHGSTSHKKSSAAEKSQDKTNQEKMDGKSSTVGEKAAKDEKTKKTSTTLGGSSRNLWVSGLATTTRATDLKQVFSKYGKVIGAKVVTNARTPGARCYGYVTMSNPDDANKAVQFLHHTELHGRLISVEKAKGDSTGPPKRSEPTKVETPAVKKIEEKKKEPIVRKVDIRKEENIVPPGTEGEVKEPEAPGTEKDASETKGEAAKEGGHKSREVVRSTERPEKRPRSVGSNHRSRGGSPVLTFDKIKEERERQRLRERERMLREEERRRETERARQREIDRKQREEFDRLDREKKKLKMERERLLREKDELLKLKSERQRLERERQKLEREKLEKEKEELERLKRQNMRLEEEARRKRSLSASREYESRKRPATDSRYVSSSSSRYPDSTRSSEYKKEPSHKSSREIAGPPRRPGFEPEATRRMVTAVPSSRESWPPKERESGRYERTAVNSASFREESISSRSKPSESRHVRERYADVPKSERFVERSDSWHGSGSTGGGGPLKTFSSRDTWVSGDRKQDGSDPWTRPTTNSSRWPLSGSTVGLGSRSGPPGSISNAVFSTNSSQGPPGLTLGMSMGSFSSGDRFDAYKQPYFKGP